MAITSAKQMNETLGSYFRHECKIRRLRQRVVAAITGRPRTTISALWNGRREWDTKDFADAAGTLGMTIPEFLSLALKIKPPKGAPQPIDPTPTPHP